MTNSKSTKRALLSSALSILMCVAMLIGTTFAWFTDQASTSVNRIQAGTLDVQLLDAAGNSIEGQTLAWQKAADASENEAVLWEPGCTYNLESFKIKNNGNLALKYKVVITGINGDAELNKVIDWKYTLESGDTFPIDEEGHLTAGEATDLITISGHMQESAGNEYQGKYIDGIAITVYATQDTVEYDSEDNQYDAEATTVSVWDGSVDAEGLTENTDEDEKIVNITSAAELAALAQNVNSGNDYAGYTINLLTSLDLGNRPWTPIGLYCTTKTSSTLLHKTFNGTFDGHGYTINNLCTTDLWGTEEYIIKGAPALFGATGDDATIKNLTVKNALVYGMNAYSYASVVVGSHVGGNLTFDNVHVEDAILSCTRHVGGLVGIAGRDANNPATVTFTDCSMTDVTMYYVHANYNESNVYGSPGHFESTKFIGLDTVTETNVTVVAEKTVTTDSTQWKYYYYKALFESMK